MTRESQTAALLARATSPAGACQASSCMARAFIAGGAALYSGGPRSTTPARSSTAHHHARLTTLHGRRRPEPQGSSQATPVALAHRRQQEAAWHIAMPTSGVYLCLLALAAQRPPGIGSMTASGRGRQQVAHGHTTAPRMTASGYCTAASPGPRGTAAAARQPSGSCSDTPIACIFGFRALKKQGSGSKDHPRHSQNHAATCTMIACRHSQQ